MATMPGPQPHDPRDSEGVDAELLQALREELAEERTRKDSLERRGLAAAAGATTALALLLGLGSRYTGIGEPVFFLVLGVGSASFLISAFYAWRTSRPLEYSEISLTEFQEILERGWTEGTLQDFRRFLADGVCDTIVVARAKNNLKVADFGRSLRFLFAGSLLVLIGIGQVIVDRIFF